MKRYSAILLVTIALSHFLLSSCKEGAAVIEEVVELDFEVIDANQNQLFEVAEELVFIPNGIPDDAKNYKWEFGLDAPAYLNKEGKVTYEAGGKYLVTLTVDAHKVDKIIRVVNRTPPTVFDTLITVEAPYMAFVGEEVFFRAHGTGIKEWYWTFGEIDGLIDNNRMPQVSHTYKQPGLYRVAVTTNLTEYPVYHVIEIQPQFEPNVEVNVVDTLLVVANKIREHLQAIANSNVSDIQTIREHRTAIQEHYLAEDISKVVVIINGSRYNDFYSYCQGIHHLDSEEKKSLSINEVIIDTVRGIQRLEISQSISTTEL